MPAITNDAHGDVMIELGNGDSIVPPGMTGAAAGSRAPHGAGTLRTIHERSGFC
jgi:hypothetical protein